MATTLNTDEPSLKYIPWLVAIAFFMQTLDGTILNTALPAIATDLKIDTSSMHSVLIAYFVTVALVIPASGWISDRFGSQRVFTFAIALFTLGSLLCALSSNLHQLTGSRIIQALGGALMLPVGRLVILKAFPRSQLVSIMSFITLPGLLGPLLGPVVGGWIVEFGSWELIFLINIPMGLAGILVTLFLMPNFKADVQRGFDWKGYILLSASIISIIIAIYNIEGSFYGIIIPSIFFLLIAFSMIIYFWRHINTVTFPIFTPLAFRSTNFSAGISGSLLSRIGSGALPFLIPLLLQVGMGYPPSVAGMSMIPLTIAGMAMKPITPRLVRLFGYKQLLTTNTIIQGLLISSLALIQQDTSLTPLWGLLVLIGACNAIQFTTMGTVTLIDLDNESASTGTSLLSVVIQLSIGISVSISGVLLAVFSHDGPGVYSESSFSWTFLILGMITLSSGILFNKLPKI